MKKLIIVFAVLTCFVSAQEHWDLVGFENANVKCIAQHPQDTSIMLISIADSIHRSSDGGHSWSFVTCFDMLPINNLTFNPLNGDTIFALVGNGSYSDGIYRSTDAGNTWDVLSWFLIPLCMTVTESGLMLVGCESLGVFKSEDGGTTWDPWNDGLTNLCISALDYCCPFDTFPYFFAGTAQGLFYRHHNGWSQAGGIAVNVRVSSISYHKTDELGFTTVTGGSWSDGMYRSTDFGQNWQVGDYWLYASCVSMNPQGEYPNDTLSVFAGDSGLGMKHSTDYGTTWSEVNTGLGNLYVNALSYHLEDTLRLFCATQGGLYRYVYPPGVSEHSTGVSGSIIEVIQTVLRTHEPILVKYCVIGEDPFREMDLGIFDLTGRKIRTAKIGANITSLEPLRKSGIYFIVPSEKEYYCKEKLIIVD